MASNMGDMFGQVLTFLIVGVLLGVAIVVLSNLATNQALTPEATNAVNSTIQAVDDFPTWFGIMVVVIAAGIIITLVLKGIGGAGNR